MSLKESIDNIREMIDEQKETLSSESYLDLMNELGKMNDLRDENVYVKLTLLYQQMLLENHSDCDNTYYLSTKVIKRIFPMSKIKFSQYNSSIVNIDKINEKKYECIGIDFDDEKVFLNVNTYEVEYNTIDGEEDGFQVRHPKYILLDCELV
tara:strand:- start:66 stop:521 length:456 start_codon:yes stop_codon:yes gene_type:complete